MVRTYSGDELVNSELRVKIRLDFKGTAQPGRFFLKGKSPEQKAEDHREQQTTLFRNVPLQGVRIEDISVGGETYIVFEEHSNQEVAYAPAELVVVVETIEDLIRFVTRTDFRIIEILEPNNIVLSRLEIERMLLRINEESRAQERRLERKYAR